MLIVSLLLICFVDDVRARTQKKAEKEGELEPSTSWRERSAIGPFKVILLGASGVGKSSMFYRIKFGKFCEDIQGQQLDTFEKTICTSNHKTVQVGRLRVFKGS